MIGRGVCLRIYSASIYAIRNDVTHPNSNAFHIHRLPFGIGIMIMFHHMKWKTWIYEVEKTNRNLRRTNFGTKRNIYYDGKKGRCWLWLFCRPVFCLYFIMVNILPLSVHFISQIWWHPRAFKWLTLISSFNAIMNGFDDA